MWNKIKQYFTNKVYIVSVIMHQDLGEGEMRYLHTIHIIKTDTEISAKKQVAEMVTNNSPEYDISDILVIEYK